jgi:hypothetical protein
MIHWLEIINHKDCMHSIIGAVWQQNTSPISALPTYPEDTGV